MSEATIEQLAKWAMEANGKAVMSAALAAAQATKAHVSALDAQIAAQRLQDATELQR